MAKSPKTDIDEGLVRKLASLMDETGLTEIEYETDDLSIRVSKGVNYAMPAPAAPAVSAPSVADAPVAVNAEAHPGTVKSPMVGVVYTSSDPDSPAFVKVGDTVSEGQTLLLIEAMKVFNPITAPKSGRVLQIFVESGSPVEFGEPLVVVE